MVALTIIGIIISAIALDIIMSYIRTLLGMYLQHKQLRGSGNRIGKVILDDHIEMHISPGVFYHRGHLWLHWRFDGKVVIGINDLIHRIIGNFDEICLPAPGKHLRHGDKAVLIRQGSKILFLLSPVSGVVFEINPLLTTNPTTSKKEPYGAGWLFKMQPEDIETSMVNLMISSQAEDWLYREIKRIRAFFKDFLQQKTYAIQQEDGFISLEGILEKMDDRVWILFKDYFVYQQEWRA